MPSPPSRRQPCRTSRAGSTSWASRLGRPGDEVTARFIDGPPLVRIDAIAGDNGRLPRDAAKNTAGIAALGALDRVGDRRGVALNIRKGLPLSSGFGGCAPAPWPPSSPSTRCSARRASRELLLTCAFEGGRVGAGCAHGDNMAQSSARRIRPRPPRESARHRLAARPRRPVAVVVHPETGDRNGARAGHPRRLRSASGAIQQWANLGFVDALRRSDFALLARSLEERIAEPERAPLVPGF